MLMTIIAVVPSVAFVILIVLMKNDLKKKLKMIKGKKKGLMKIEFYNKANNHFTYFEIPNSGKVDINGLKYLVEKGTIYYDPIDAIQCLLVREGDMKTKNINETEKSRIDPQELDLALKAAYALGKQEMLDFGDMKTIRQMVMITLGLSAIGAILSYLGM
jgi:hypothetical protein